MEAKKILIDKNKFLRESGVSLENYTPEQILLWVTRLLRGQERNKY